MPFSSWDSKRKLEGRKRVGTLFNTWDSWAMVEDMKGLEFLRTFPWCRYQKSV